MSMNPFRRPLPPALAELYRSHETVLSNATNIHPSFPQLQDSKSPGINLSDNLASLDDPQSTKFATDNPPPYQEVARMPHLLPGNIVDFRDFDPSSKVTVDEVQVLSEISDHPLQLYDSWLNELRLWSNTASSRIASTTPPTAASHRTRHLAFAETLEEDPPFLVTSSERMSSAYQSEISRGKRPVQESTSPFMDFGSLATDVQSLASTLHVTSASSPSRASYNGGLLQSDKTASAGHPEFLVPMSAYTPDSLQRLYNQLTELRNDNVLLMDQCKELEDKINVLLGRVQSLSPLIPTEQHKRFISESSVAGPSRSNLVDRQKPLPGTPQETRQHHRISMTSPSHQETRLHDEYTNSEPAMNEKITNFLETTRSLRLAMEKQAAWLLDEINTHYALFPQQLFEDPLSEKPESINRPMFLCGICLEEYLEEDVARINDCQHGFCRSCIRSYIISKIKDHCYPIFCPTCMADPIAEGDPIAISTELVQQVGIPDKDFAVLEQLQLSAYSILWHCRKCKQSVFVDKQEFMSFDVIICPLPGCNYRCCKLCGQRIRHRVPHSCDGVQELDKLMKKKGWRYCPGCSSPIQKESGCNHIICLSPGCHTHFCYLCGEKIVQSSLAREIEESVKTHFRKCTLFESDP